MDRIELRRRIDGVINWMLEEARLKPAARKAMLTDPFIHSTYNALCGLADAIRDKETEVQSEKPRGTHETLNYIPDGSEPADSKLCHNCAINQAQSGRVNPDQLQRLARGNLGPDAFTKQYINKPLTLASGELDPKPKPKR